MIWDFIVFGILGRLLWVTTFDVEVFYWMFGVCCTCGLCGFVFGRFGHFAMFVWLVGCGFGWVWAFAGYFEFVWVCLRFDADICGYAGIRPNLFYLYFC